MTVTLVVSAAVMSELRDMTQLECESAAVLLGRVVQTPLGDLRILCTSIHHVPNGAYTERTSTEMVITSAGYMTALGRAEQSQSVAIWVHAHVLAEFGPRPSERDQKVDEGLSAVFRCRSGGPYYGSLVVAMRQQQMVFTGLVDNGSEKVRIERVLVVGERLALLINEELDAEPLAPLYDRNVRAFGGPLQRVIGDLTFAVVGCGGTGSSVIEQLARLGARSFILFDPDVLTVSNLTRVYGSAPTDVGRLKVDVQRDHVTRIAPGASVRSHPSTITNQDTAIALQDADIIFGCTDDNAGRLVLSRHSSYMMTPVIDCGVLLTSNDEGQVEGIHGRVTVLTPGAACLLCRDRIDLARAGAELLPPDEHHRLAMEGYAPALGNVEPSVVTFTSLVAATAVTELLERFVAFGPEPVPSETVLRIHDRDVSTNLAVPREHCYCHPESNKLGAGTTAQYLGMLWES